MRREDLIDKQSNLVVVEDGVYDLGKFLAKHPGGPHVLGLFGGKDATLHYHSYHFHPKRSEKLEPFRVGTLHPADIDHSYEVPSQFFLDLKKKIKNELKSTWADWRFYTKAVLILLSTFALEYYTIAYGRELWSSVLLGFLFALIGLNIQHDANHNAISKTWWVNRLFGYSQDWIGGSSILWRHQHVLLHHTETNRFATDPDSNSTVVRFNWSQKYKFFFKIQHWYTIPLMPLLPLFWVFANTFDLLAMFHKHHVISPLSQGEVHIALIFKFFFLIRFYAIPLYLYPSLHTISMIGVTMAVTGLYLGFFFILSHNFLGVGEMAKEFSGEDWAKTQIRTSSNVAGAWLATLNGGLNYQIEHHLFPRVSHIHYARIAPIVAQHCKEHGVNYVHFPTVFENLVSMISHLKVLGSGPKRKAQ